MSSFLFFEKKAGLLAEIKTRATDICGQARPPSDLRTHVLIKEKSKRRAELARLIAD